MMRIGLIADTHIPEAGRELPHQVYAAFNQVDLILHAGDLHTLTVLDWLERLAPVLSARGNGDEGPPITWRPRVPDDPRLKDAQVLETEGLRIGLIHVFPFPEEYPSFDLKRYSLKHFGGPVDIIVCGDTHVELVRELNGTMVVNPGSPTLPHQMPNMLGTVGLLEIDRGKARAEILRLKDLKA